MSRENVETIERIYGAFGRGDIDTIVQNVSDDTVWGFNVSGSDVPWHAQVCGKENLPRFFEALLGNVEFRAFEPRAFIDSGEDVVAHVYMEYVVKRSGTPVNEEMLMWWRVGPDGKVTRLTHYEDTGQVERAYGA